MPLNVKNYQTQLEEMVDESIAPFSTFQVLDAIARRHKGQSMESDVREAVKRLQKRLKETD